MLGHVGLWTWCPGVSVNVRGDVEGFLGIGGLCEGLVTSCGLQQPLCGGSLGPGLILPGHSPIYLLWCRRSCGKGTGGQLSGQELWRAAVSA